MTPPTSLVPSKNALRALRHLALSTPSILVGTVGSICGVAALDYETRRRVRVAEKIVETKRILRSVSSGRGTAHLNARFEAAERGEDFSLRSRSPRKRRREHGSRSLSTAVVPDNLDDSSESRPPETVKPFISLPGHGYESGSGPDVGSAGSDTPAVKWSRNKPFRKILSMAHKEENTTPLESVQNRPASLYQSQTDIFPGCVERWLTQGTTENGDTDLDTGLDYPRSDINPRGTPAKQDLPSGEVRLAGAANQSRTHGHGLRWTPLPYASPAVAHTQLPVGGCYHQIGPSCFELSRYISKAKRKMPDEQSSCFSIPHHLVTCDADESMEQALREHLDSAKGARLPNPHSSCPFFPFQAVDRATQAVDPDTLLMLMDFIHPTTRQTSKPTQFRRWTAVMRHYIQQDRSPDWLVAEAVFCAGRGLFKDADVLSQPLFDLLRHLLSTEPNGERARKILFPSQPLGQKNSAVEQSAMDNYFGLAVKYLTLFCEHTEDHSACVQEMAKIIDIARRSGYEPSEKFAMPILQAVVRTGNIEAARSVLHMLDSMYELREMQRLRGEYAVWNAATGNWEEAQWILDQLQETGYSRHQPEQYATIFHRMLMHYSSKNPAHRTFGFAVNAIKYTGLIPIGRISRTIVRACIRDSRYDLVLEWTRLVSEAFPRLTSSFTTASGAWQLAHALQSAGASCRDIADTCRAIAHGCYDDPFPHYLRPLLADLVKLDLSQRLNAASALPSEVLLSRDGIPLMSMNQLLEEARHFCTLPRAVDNEAATIDKLKRDIAVQLDAVDELTRVLRGDVFMPDVADPTDNETPEPVTIRRNPTSDTRQPALNPALPDVFKQDKLPGYKDLSTAVITYYSTRAKQGFPVDHSLLEYLIDKVALDNPADALNLIERIHESEYVQGVSGVPFDNQIFVKWLQVVVTVGSAKAASTVLWAVVDSSRHLTWTLNFSFCINLVTHLSMAYVKGKQRVVLTPEMFYLGRRLWWTRQRVLSHVEDDFEFPKWQPWELALRDVASRPTDGQQEQKQNVDVAFEGRR